MPAPAWAGAEDPGGAGRGAALPWRGGEERSLSHVEGEDVQNRTGGNFKTQRFGNRPREGQLLLQRQSQTQDAGFPAPGFPQARAWPVPPSSSRCKDLSSFSAGLCLSFPAQSRRSANIW